MILKPPSFLDNFPSEIESPIDRSNVTSLLFELLNTGIEVVFLEGDEGDGATATIQNFYDAHKDQCFALFIKPASKSSHNLDYLRNCLGEQYFRFINKEDFKGEYIDENLFTTLQIRIRSLSRKSHVFILVDGLHQLFNEDPTSARAVFKELLPIGINKFKFIISGKEKDLGGYCKSVETKPYSLLKFTKSETDAYLKDLNLCDTDLQVLFKSTKGSPGKLASLRRILRSGGRIEEVLKAIEKNENEYLNLEFKSIECATEDERKVVACLAFAKEKVTLEELATIASVQIDEVKQIAEKSLFLIKKDSDEIEFRSESRRIHAEKILNALKNKAITCQLEYLLKNPSGDKALRFIPTYLEQLGKQKQILEFISKNHYLELLGSTKSLNLLKQRAELGAKSAAEIKEVVDIFKFSLQSSILSDASKLGGFGDEVTALVNLGKTDLALQMAGRVGTIEEKLTLLASYARRTVERGGRVDEGLLSHIRELTGQITFAGYANANKIAADMLFVDVDLAIGIIESSTHGAKNELALKNKAFANLSIVASATRKGNSSAEEEKVKSKIKDDGLIQIVSSLTTIFRDFSLQQFIEFGKNLDFKARLYIFKLLVRGAPKREGALELAEHAITQIVNETSYVPKLKDFADLSYCLPFAVGDAKKLHSLLQRFDSQTGLVSDISEAKYKVAVNTNLSILQFRYDPEAGRSRLEQTYYDVLGSLPESRIECFALMLSIISNYDVDRSLENSVNMMEIINKDLMDAVTEVIANTGDQFEVIKSSLSSLSSYSPEAAVEVAKRLNTEGRRNEAFWQIASDLIKGKHSAEAEATAKKCVDNFSDAEDRTEFYSSLLQAAKDTNSSGWTSWIRALAPQIDDETARFVFEFDLADLEIKHSLRINVDDLISNLSSKSDLIDSKLDLANLYFKLSSVASKINLEHAEALFDKGKSHKQELELDSQESLSILQICLSLCLRIFKTLIKSDVFSRDLYERFSRLVDKLCLTEARVAFYSDLACKAWCVGKTELATEIVKSHCLPLLEASKTAHDATQLLRIVFPALFLTVPITALERLKIFKSNHDWVLRTTALVILRKRTNSEIPRDAEPVYVRIDKTDVDNVMLLLRRMTTDNTIYGVAKHLINSMSDKVNKTSFTSEQKADIAFDINELCEDKLPDLKNIGHDGYKILLKGLTLKLLKGNQPDWLTIKQRADLIPNASDRAYVAIELAENIPPRYNINKSAVISQALADIRSIPSNIDRLSRLESYLDVARTHSATNIKAILSDALATTFDVPDQKQAENYRRSFLDIAEKIHPGLNDTLIEGIDDDPARAEAKAIIKENVKVAKLKDTMCSRSPKEISNEDVHLLPGAASRALRSLAGGKLSLLSTQQLSSYVLTAGGFDLERAHPVLALLIENSAAKYTSAKDVAEHILPLSEAVLLSTEIAVEVIAKSRQKSFSPAFTQQTASHSLLLKAGSRDDALQLIMNWLSELQPSNIIYCDPYFSFEDLSFLKIVLSACPDASITIISALKNIERAQFTPENALASWSEISDQEPPVTEMIAISGDFPILHDRWIIVESGGLRIGTSFNSLGVSSLSEISPIEESRHLQLLNELSRFCRKDKIVDGKRVLYSNISF